MNPTLFAIGSLLSSSGLLMVVTNRVLGAWPHVFFWLFVATTAGLVLTSERLGRYTRAVTFVLLLATFRIVVLAPYQTDVISRWPDGWYSLQLANSIRAFGHIDLTGLSYSGEAASYAFHPSLEILSTVTSSLGGVDILTTVRFSGYIIGFVPPAVVYLTVGKIWHNPRISFGSALIFGLSPWYVTFNSYPVHDTLGLVAISLFVYALVGGARVSWRLVALISVGFGVVSHVTTSYVLVALMALIITIPFVMAKLHLFGRQRGSPRLVPKGLFALSLCLAVGWGAFIALVSLQAVARFWQSALSRAFAPDLNVTAFSPAGLKPDWIVAASYVGFAAFGIALLGGIVRIVQRKTDWPENGITVGLAGIVLAGSMGFLWLGVASQALDLLPRAITYLFMFSTPLALAAVLTLEKARLRPLRREGFRRVLVVGVLVLVLLPSLYYGVHPDVYLNQSPPTSEGLNNSYQEWLAAADFARQVPPSAKQWGVRMGYSFIGGWGGRTYFQTDFGGNITSWLRTKDTDGNADYVYVRQSLDGVPDLNGFTVSAGELNFVESQYNVVLSSGDVRVVLA